MLASRTPAPALVSRLKEIDEEAFIYSILDHEILYGHLEIPPKRVRRPSEPATPADGDWSKGENWRGVNLEELWGVAPSESAVETEAGTELAEMSEPEMVEKGNNLNMEWRKAHTELQ